MNAIDQLIKSTWIYFDSSIFMQMEILKFAMTQYQELLQFCSTLAIETNTTFKAIQASLHCNLAYCLATLGQPYEAIKEFDTAFEKTQIDFNP